MSTPAVALCHYDKHKPMTAPTSLLLFYSFTEAREWLQRNLDSIADRTDDDA